MITSIVLFSLVIEIGLRVTGLQTTSPKPPEIYQNSSNPNIGYELRPDLRDVEAYRATVSTDSNGFRLNTATPQPSGRKLTVVLGDSITFGYGVGNDQTLPAKLSEIDMNSHYLNAAVPGYQLQQQTAAYTEKMKKLNPHHVMMVFFWNDLDGMGPGFIDEQGILRPHGWQPGGVECRPITTGIMGLIPGKCWLDQHSAFYKAVKKLVDIRSSRQRQEAEREIAADIPSQEPISDEALNLYARELALLALEFPLKRTFVIWPDNFLHEKERERLRNIAESMRFEVIDLYDLFGREVETLPWDTVHPSPKAIEEAASFIQGML